MQKSQNHIVMGRTLSFRHSPNNDNSEDCCIFEETGAIAIKSDGRIAWNGPFSDLPPQYREWSTKNYGDCIILPGFVDAHLHFPQYRMIAAFGKDLLDWLNRYTFAEEQLYSDSLFAAQSAQSFLDELIRNGTTSALTFSTNHTTALTALFSEAESRNMAVISGINLMDRNVPEGLRVNSDTCFNENKSLIDQWNGRGRIGYAITPRFAVTSTEKLLDIAGTLVKEHPSLILQTHLSENSKEIQTVAEDFPWSKDYTDVYDRFGLLGPRSIFAHGIHLSERELERLNESESAVVHCPTSNNFLGSGLFQLKHAESCLQVEKIGLGCDVGGGTSYSMLQTLNDAYKVSQLAGQRITAFEGFYMATAGNAKLLGISDQVGTLECGKFADLVVLDPCATPLMQARNSISNSLHDILFALMIMGDDRAVRETYVAGQPLKSKLGN